MPELSLESKPVREYDVRSRVYANDYLLLRVHVTMRTNGVGFEMWKLFDGTRTISEVAAEVAADFGAPHEDVEHDALDFAAELLEAQFVTIS